MIKRLQSRIPVFIGKNFCFHVVLCRTDESSHTLGGMRKGGVKGPEREVETREARCLGVGKVCVRKRGDVQEIGQPSITSYSGELLGAQSVE